MNGTDYFFDVGGKRVFLQREPRRFAVRFSGRGRSDGSTLGKHIRDFLMEDNEIERFFPKYGLHAYRLRDSAAGNLIRRLRGTDVGESPSMDDSVAYDKLIQETGEEPDIDVVLPAFKRSDAPDDIMWVNNRFVIEFKPEVNSDDARALVESLNALHGVVTEKELEYGQGLGFVLKTPSGTGSKGPVALAQAYYDAADGTMAYASPEFIQRQRRRRLSPEWKFQTQQWHLGLANVLQAWAEHTHGDQQVTVAICDDGVDTSHPEFSQRVKAQFDFGFGVADGTPKLAIDNHGTACAGVALAGGVAARGVAPGCSLMAVRFPDEMGSVDEAQMFYWMAQNGASIISCSWGPPDATGGVYPLPPNVRSAIRYCATNGRGGHGIPILWAAGNGNELVSNDGYAANPDVIAVGAVNSQNQRSVYSDYGPELFISAPSSGNTSAGDPRVFTTDRTGAAGYTAASQGSGSTAFSAEYTDDFGGTSASAPLAAGVVALMLSVNPDLSVGQVRDILKRTAKKVPIQDGYDSSGHSRYTGYGVVDAGAAVAAASTSDAQPDPPTTRETYSINGPKDHDADAGAPVFQVTTVTPQAYWAVELASKSELFDSPNHGAQRNSQNFYASWTTGFSQGSRFVPPPDVWNSLKASKRLYYRLWVNDSETAWGNADVTVPRTSHASSPYVSIIGEPSDVTPTEEPTSGSSVLLGPERAARTGPPPVFQLHIPQGRYHAVEVATDPRLFQDRSARTPGSFYASWQTNAQFSNTNQYALEEWVWSLLNHADRLYYRLWTSSSATEWQEAQADPPAADYQQARFIQLTP